ncbi:MAG TPA: hypothetical protein PKL97_07210 [Candidatus Omnitrophota bacterium]|nr:hypothetical protein [Candidatus Omnitrophota bacterium]
MPILNRKQSKNYKKLLAATLALMLFGGSGKPVFSEVESASAAIPLCTKTDFAGTFLIPSSIGTVESFNWEGRDRPFVVLIRDAHAVTDAQKNIEKLTLFLQERYGINLVALEGGKGKLDTLFFRAFPDQPILRETMDGYLEAGELTGPEMAAIFSPSDLDCYGIEDWELYMRNYTAYLKAVEAQPAAKEALRKIRVRLDAERKLTYSKEHNEFHEMRIAFSGRPDRLPVFAAYLEKLIKPEEMKERYPELGKFISVTRPVSTEERESFVLAVKTLESDFRKSGYKCLSPSAQNKINGWRQEFLTGRLDATVFLQLLVRTARSAGLRVKLTARMRAELDRLRRIQSLRGPLLFGEIEACANKIETNICQTPQERELARKFSHLRFFEDLIELKITREQYLVFERNRKDYQDIFSDSRRSMVSIEFYRNALKRDGKLFQNLKTLLARTGQNAAVTVLGGFHTEGFANRLRAEGFSYAVVCPNSETPDGQEKYGALMEGKTSYGGDSSRNGYESFLADAASRLGRSLDPDGFQATLKLWRDRTLGFFSKNGRISESSRYVRILDNLLWQRFENPETLSREPSRAKAVKVIERALHRAENQNKEHLLERFRRQYGFMIRRIRVMAQKGSSANAKLQKLFYGQDAKRVSQFAPKLVLDPKIPVINLAAIKAAPLPQAASLGEDEKLRTALSKFELETQVLDPVSKQPVRARVRLSRENDRFRRSKENREYQIRPSREPASKGVLVLESFTPDGASVIAGVLYYEIDEHEGLPSLGIDDLSVADDYRAIAGESRALKYVGTRLMEAAVRLSRSIPGVGGAIDLGMNGDNYKAESFYSSMTRQGFEERLGEERVKKFFGSRNFGLKSYSVGEDLIWYLEKDHSAEFLRAMEWSVKEAILGDSMGKESAEEIHERLKRACDFSYETERMKVFYANGTRYEFSPDGRLTGKVEADAPARPWSELFEISREIETIRAGILERLLALDPERYLTYKNIREGLSYHGEDDTQITHLDQLLSDGHFVEKFRRDPDFSECLGRLIAAKKIIELFQWDQEEGLRLINPAIDQRKERLTEALRQLRNVPHPVLNVFVESHVGEGVLGMARLLAESAVHQLGNLHVNIVYTNDTRTSPSMKMLEFSSPRIRFLNLTHHYTTEWAHQHPAPMNVMVVEPAQLTRLETRPIHVFQYPQRNHMPWRRHRVSFDMRDPFGTIILDGRLRTRKRHRDRWSPEELVRHRDQWLEETFQTPREKTRLLKLRTVARQNGWQPEKAIWTWGYFQDMELFTKELGTLAKAFSPGPVDRVPFADGGRQLLVHLIPGGWLTAPLLPWEFAQMGFTVIDRDGTVTEPPPERKIPVTLFMYYGVQHDRLETLQCELNGTLSKTRDDSGEFFVDFPAFVTGTASHLEALSSESIYLHDDFDIERFAKREVLEDYLVKALYLEGHGKQSLAQLRAMAGDRAQDFLMGQGRGLSRYADLENWTRAARKHAESLYLFNAADDLLIQLAEAYREEPGKSASSLGKADEDYQALASRARFRYEANGRKIVYAEDSRFEFDSDGALLRSFAAGQIDRPWKEELAELSAVLVDLRREILERLFTPAPEIRSKFARYAHLPDRALEDDWMIDNAEKLMAKRAPPINPSPEVDALKKRLAAAEQVFGALVETRNDHAGLHRQAVQKRVLLADSAIRKLAEIPEPTVNIYVINTIGAGFLGTARLLAEGLVHRVPALKVNVFVAQESNIPGKMGIHGKKVAGDDFAREIAAEPGIRILEGSEDQISVWKYHSRAPLHIQVGTDYGFWEPDDEVVDFSTFTVAQGYRKNSPRYYRSAATNDLLDPDGSVYLDPGLLERRKARDSWPLAQMEKARAKWLNRVIGKKSTRRSSLDGIARQEKWNPLRAIWTWGYFQSTPQFIEEMSILSALLSSRYANDIPFRDGGGRQILFHLIPGEWAQSPGDPEKTLSTRELLIALTSMGFAVIDSTGVLHCPEDAPRVPLTVVLYEAIDHASLVTLQSELNGCFKKFRDEKGMLFIDFPALVTGTSSWLETAGCGGIYLHDGYDATHNQKRDMLLSIIAKRRASSGDTRQTFEELRFGSVREAAHYLAGDWNHFDRYRQLREWTRESRDFTEFLYSMNTVDDLLIRLADAYARGASLGTSRRTERSPILIPEPAQDAFRKLEVIGESPHETAWPQIRQILETWKASSEKELTESDHQVFEAVRKAVRKALHSIQNRGELLGWLADPGKFRAQLRPLEAILGTNEVENITRQVWTEWSGEPFGPASFPSENARLSEAARALIAQPFDALIPIVQAALAERTQKPNGSAIEGTASGPSSAGIAEHPAVVMDAEILAACGEGEADLDDLSAFLNGYITKEKECVIPYPKARERLASRLRQNFVGLRIFRYDRHRPISPARLHLKSKSPLMILAHGTPVKIPVDGRPEFCRNGIYAETDAVSASRLDAPALVKLLALVTGSTLRFRLKESPQGFLVLDHQALNGLIGILNDLAETQAVRRALARAA